MAERDIELAANCWVRAVPASFGARSPWDHLVVLRAEDDFVFQKTAGERCETVGPEESVSA